MLTTTNPRKEPELITIISDSDNESIDMVLSHTNNISHDRNINLWNENNCTPFQASIKKKKKYFTYNSVNKSNDISVIELNDSSLDSIHSVGTKTHPNTPNTKTFINDDERTVISTVTKFFSTNSSNTQMPSSSSNNFIDLINDSSSDSIFTIDKIKNDNSLTSVSTLPLNNTQQNCQNFSTPLSNVLRKINSPSHDSLTTKFETDNCVSNASPLKDAMSSNFSFPIADEKYGVNINTKTNEDLCSTNSSSNTILPKCRNSKLLSNNTEQLFQCNMSSKCLNSTSCTEINNEENNDNISNRICSNTKNVLDSPNSDVEQLVNIISKEIVTLPSNYYANSLANIKEVVNLTTCLSSEHTHTSFRPYSSQIESIQLPITSQITSSNEKDDEQNKSTVEQIIDDPWMDYNDWQSINISSKYAPSPVLLEKNSMVLVNDPEILTTPLKIEHHINQFYYTTVYKCEK